MRAILLSLALGCFSTGSTAQAVNSDSEADAVCSASGSLAASIMLLRQQNKPLSLVMKTLLAPVEQSPDAQNIIRQLVLSAYEMPAFHTEENQQRAISDFQNTTELACYQAMTK